jgi:mercuric ion binding protein
MNLVTGSKMKLFFSVLSLLLFSNHALAADRTAKFDVPGMTCALCPLTIETAIGQVTGVKNVNADFHTLSAVAVFDDALTSPEQIAEASANAGYPAKLVSLQ